MTNLHRKAISELRNRGRLLIGARTFASSVHYKTARWLVREGYATWGPGKDSIRSMT